MQDDQRIVHLWQETLEQAFLENATDIHIEALIDFTLLRFRIDGTLRVFRKIKAVHHEHLCAHIKVLAELDIAEKRLPQDGSLKFELHLTSMPKQDSLTKHQIDCRISTVPTLYGEKIVVRLLTNPYGQLQISQLGFDAAQLALVKETIDAPQGLILITGPTGSGKTVTLYNFLSYLNDGSKNISTVEDPPEIKMPGINQIAINEKSGMDFARSLRALLRQDPDIIMIGEIRDSVTAKIALQAAQTGHLVFASLHTNSAIATIHRLLHLGCEKDVLASCLLMVTAQRLLRKKCQNCIRTQSDCGVCKNTRFSGRTAIHEVLKIVPPIRQAIENGAPSSEIFKLSQSFGMRSLIEQGRSLVEKGVTSASEVHHKIGEIH